MKSGRSSGVDVRAQHGEEYTDGEPSAVASHGVLPAISQWRVASSAYPIGSPSRDAIPPPADWQWASSRR